jgi:hypothetical protein
MIGIDYSSICVAFQSASEPSECGECLHDCVTPEKYTSAKRGQNHVRHSKQQTGGTHVDSALDFATFIKSLPGLSDTEIKHRVTAKNAELRHLENSHKSRHVREEQTTRFQGQLSGLLWWIDTGIKPDSMSEEDFALCRDLIKRRLN